MKTLEKCIELHGKSLNEYEIADIKKRAVEFAYVANQVPSRDPVQVALASIIDELNGELTNPDPENPGLYDQAIAQGWVKPEAPEAKAAPAKQPPTPPIKPRIEEKGKGEGKVKELWEMSRERAVWGEYAPDGLSTDRALAARLARWEKIKREAKNVKIESVEQAIAKEKDRIARANAHREAVQKAISEGKITSHPDYPELTAKPPAKPAAAKTSDLLPLITSLQPAGQPRALVSISQLRDQANMPGEAFDAALLQLSRDGKVALHQHDFPGSLSEAERAKLLAVKDGMANRAGGGEPGVSYYVGVVPKGETGKVEGKAPEAFKVGDLVEPTDKARSIVGDIKGKIVRIGGGRKDGVIEIKIEGSNPYWNANDFQLVKAPTGEEKPKRFPQSYVDGLYKENIIQPLIKDRRKGFEEILGQSLTDKQTGDLMIEMMQWGKERGDLSLIGDSSPVQPEWFIKDAWDRVKPSEEKATPAPLPVAKEEGKAQGQAKAEWVAEKHWSGATMWRLKGTEWKILTEKGTGKPYGVKHGEGDNQIALDSFPTLGKAKASILAEIEEGEPTLKYWRQQEAKKGEEAPVAEKVEIKETAKGPVVSADFTKKEEGKLTLKEQKEYLLAEIDKAIEAAPEVSEYVREDLSKPLAWKEYTKEEAVERDAEVDKYLKSLDKNPAYVTIEVPGDGKFRIFNSKDSLMEFKKRAGKFPVVLSRPKITATTPSTKASAEKEETIGPLVRIVGKVDGYEWFTDGHVMIRGTPPKGAKYVTPEEAKAVMGTTSVNADTIKGTIPAEKNLKSAKVAFFAFDDADVGQGVSTSPIPRLSDEKNRISQFVVIESPGGYRAVYQQGLFNAIRNRFPNAKLKIWDHQKITPESPLVAYEKGKVVAVVMPMRDPLSEMPYIMAEEAGYIKGEKPETPAELPKETEGQIEDISGQITPSDVNTPEFKAWFKKSKVVDANGEPLVEYHATREIFRSFKIGDIGFHFGTSKVANSRTANTLYGYPNIIPAYLSIQNPLRMPDVIGWRDASRVWNGIPLDVKHNIPIKIATKIEKQINELSKIRFDSEDYSQLRQATQQTIREALFKLGYDGIVYQNLAEGNKEDDSYIAFSPTQIKSIFNRGTWDETIEDISSRSTATTAKFPGHPTIDRINKRLDPIRQALPGLPPVYVVQNWAGMPQGVQTFYEKKGHTGRYKALYVRYTNGKVAIYIIADRHAGLNSTINSLWHEGGHHVLRLLYKQGSPEFNAFLDDLYGSKFQKEIDDLGAGKLINGERKGGYGFDIETVEGRRKSADEWWARSFADNKAYSQDPLYRRMWDRFVTIVRRMLNKIGIHTPMSRAEIRDMMRRGYEELKKGQAVSQPGKLEIRGLLAGEKAQGKPTGMSNAMEMSKQGASEAEIWEKTGWLKGAEGKWRFEIDDSKAEWKPFSKWYKRATIPEYTHEVKVWIGLMDVLDHPELFKHYPQLRFVNFEVDRNGKDVYYNDAENTIRLTEDALNNREKGKELLFHEIQHVIQKIEGFARGGSPESLRKGLVMSDDDYKAWTDEVFNKLRVVELFNKAEKKGITAKQALAEESKSWGIDTGNSRIRDLLDVVDLKADAERLWKEDKARLDKYVKETFLDPDAEYRRLAGEIESRDTSARLRYDAEMRKIIPPYSSENIPRSQWIVRDGTGTSFSVEEKPATMGAMAEKPGKADITTVEPGKAVGGNPFKESLVQEAVFHGGEAPILDFSRGAKRGGEAGQAFFTDTESVAKAYAETNQPPGANAKKFREGHVGKYHIDILNPITDQTTYREFFQDKADDAFDSIRDFISDGNRYDLEDFKESNLDKFWEYIEEVKVDFPPLSENYVAVKDKPLLQSIMLGMKNNPNYRDAVRKRYDGFMFNDYENGGKTYIPFSDKQIKLVPSPSRLPESGVLYHGSNIPIENLKPGKDGGIHIGTESQARMRNSKYVYAVDLDTSKFKRERDTGGDWKAKIERAKKAGHEGIVYLNRYEGIDRDKYLKLLDEGWTGEKLDALSDKEFKKLLPDMQDSYIAFSSDQVKIRPDKTSLPESGGQIEDISGQITPSDVDTPEFKKWSKGLPLIKEGQSLPKSGGYAVEAYHGTLAPEDFTSFAVGEDVSTEQDELYRSGSGGDPTTFLGSHFAKEASIASRFAKGLYGERAYQKSGGRVIPAYIRLSKPYKTSDYKMLDEMLEGSYNASSIEEAMDFDEEAFEKYESDSEYRAEINKKALEIENGYDEPIYELARDMASRYRSKLQEQGYDGIEYENEVEGGTSFIIFEPTQAKSIFNRGTWDESIEDISGALAEEGTLTGDQKAFDEEHGKDSLEIFDTIRNFVKADKRGWRKQKPDISWLDRIISVPLHHFQKVPSLFEMFKDGLKKTDNYYTLQDVVLKRPDNQYSTNLLTALKKKDPGSYKKTKEYLTSRDRNALGHKVQHDKDADTYAVTFGKITVGTFKSEEQAWAAARADELKRMAEAGFTKDAIDSVGGFRFSTDNGFRILMKNIRDIIAKFEEMDLPLPEVAIKDENGDTVKVDLKVALAKMGDIRGYYFPRIRRPGQYMLTAEKEGVNPILEFFDTKVFLSGRQVQLEKQGYKVTKDLSPKMPEDVFQMAGETVAMQAMINQALDRMHTQGITLDDFGIKGERKGDDFIITGPTTKKMNKVLKEKMGGRFYGSKFDQKEVWHFVNAGKDFENRLATALAEEVDVIGQHMDVLFAKTLAEQVANVIKGRGHRAHMIKRAGARGEEVWLGYEEDPAIALAQYARGIASGEAKKTMALNMVRHFTGTDVSWKEFKAENEDATYDDYRALVEEKRINPTKQPNAFKEAKVFMEDMLRNQEHIDRVMGTIKGIAVLKYLAGRVSAPLVNLTALATSAPAAISGYADVGIARSMVAIGKAGRLYTQYKFKNKSVSPETARLFEEIESKGWHKAQYNREALSVLESRVGRHWNNLIEYSMAMFGVTEQLNRVSTIAGAYFAMKDAAIKNGNAFDHDEMLQKAKEISDKAHAVYNKANIPGWARGGGIGAQVAKSFYIFKTFSHNYLLTMYDLGFNQKQAKAALYMAVSPMVLAGTGALVGKQIITGIMQALGIGGDDPEEEFYSWIHENAGAKAETIARYGIFGLPGVSLKGSLEIGILDIPTSIKDVLGAPGGLFADLYYGGRSIARGDMLKGVEKISPNFIGSMFRAYREGTEGLTTRTNAPLFYGKKPVVADTVDSIYRFMSFNPARIAGIREQQWKEKQIESKYTSLRTDIYAKFKRYYLKPPAKREKAEYIDLLTEVKEYNERLKENKLDKRGIPSITSKSIKINMKRAFKPSKRERLRTGTEEE